ncbi:MAG: hypothetical protein ACLGI6_23910, partial [Gammaproteobacteria bacterium]
ELEYSMVYSTDPIIDEYMNGAKTLLDGVFSQNWPDVADKALDDRLRHYDSWLQARNLANEASDESVEALVGAVRDRYELPRRWYRLKARLLGLDRLLCQDEPKLVDGTVHNAHQVDALSGTLTALLAGRQAVSGDAVRAVREDW